MNESMTAATTSSNASSATQTRRPWWRSIGPGLLTACVVIGPGSILTSSQVGAESGYSKMWVVFAAVIFMLAYVKMASRLGAVTGRSTLDLVAERAGRWLAVMIGVSVFLIAALYQSGNNLGVHTALNEVSIMAVDAAENNLGIETGLKEHLPFRYWTVVFNALAILFVFGFHNLYSALEKLMMVLVAVMLGAFAINLAFARPDPATIWKEMIPRGGMSEFSLPLLGLVGTTFVIPAAFYQSYLVRFKGWTVRDLRTGLTDARVSALIMCVITLMIMITAAAVLRGKELANAADVANQLRPLFGDAGKLIFCLGLFAAAFSSFIINSMIGGFLLADSFHAGSMPRDRVPRVLTAAVLLTGMGMALFILSRDVKPVFAIVAAQAATVLAAPLLAATLLWLSNLKSVMGEYRNDWLTNVVGATGLLAVIGFAIHIAVNRMLPEIQRMLE